MAILFKDTFTRANNSTTLGNAETGQTWQYFPSNVFGILNNGAVPYSDGYPNVAYIDSGKSDVKLTVTAGQNYDWVYFVCAFRINPVNKSFLLLQGNATNIVLKWYNGTGYTDLSTINGQTVTAGDVFQVIANGTTIDIYRNSVKVGTATTTNNQTATAHGMGNTGAQDGELWRDIQVEDLPTTVLVSDSFDRANNTISLGSTDSIFGGTSKAWNVYQAAGVTAKYGIINNTAYQSTPSGNGDNQFAAVDVGKSDVQVQLTFTAALGNTLGTMVLRADGSLINYIMVQAWTNQYAIVEYTSSTNNFNTIGTFGGTPAAGDVLCATCQGTTIKVSLNGGTETVVTTTFNQNATLFGFNGECDTTNKYDNFIIYDLPVAPSMKVWNGTSFVSVPKTNVKYWNGTSFIGVTGVKQWNGSTWQTIL